MTGRVTRAALIALAAALALPTPARADVIESGLVVRIEEREIYFNLGAGQELTPGASIRIKHPLKLRHPVTGKMVQDWLPVGSATVTAVGHQLAMAVLDPDLLTQVQVGDRIEALVVRTETAAPPEPAPAPEPPPDDLDQPLPAVPPATAEVLKVWRDSAGRPLEARIAAWELYLERNPDSAFAPAIREDLELLRAERERIRPIELSLEERRVRGLDHAPPTRARPGRPIDLVFVLEDPGELAAAWLHYRPRGATSFKKTILHRDDDYYLRGEIPADAVVDPGVEYFVEMATQGGEVGSAIGDPEQPDQIAVATPPLTDRFTDQRHRSRMEMRASYLDFATFDGRAGDHTDQFFLFESDFLYRLRGPIYGIRSGLGVLAGRGGYADEVYSPTRKAPEAGFNYGYTEIEVRGPARTAYRGRLVAGAGRDGFGLGVEGRFRLGDEDGTNLSLGASKLAEIGFLTEIRMQWDALAHFPIGLAVAITDQPNNGDLGVRLTTDLAWRALPWLQPTLRVSYQARTVVHSGVGAGFGLVFDW